ncbi:MAG TPA: N-formylglutamate amidohydrolase [Kaistia sp.]|nr:N-formylglutamate amidohydrolase [Kaistia sp.]
MSSLSTPGLAMKHGASDAPLLSADEPAPVEVIAARADPFVFVCEHASNRVPRALGDLGLPPEAFERHIAWDPGAALLTRALARRFGGAAVLQAYSRLVIDCNRAPELADAITPLSEDTAIPGNGDLAAADRARRIEAVWTPFHAAIDAMMAARHMAARPTVFVTLHSFTPVYRGVARPWHVGLIEADDRRLAEPMLAALEADPALVVGDNQPYSAKDNVDYTIRRHGRNRDLPHVMIEVRNDLLRTPSDIEAWTRRLGDALAAGTCGLGIDLSEAAAED